MKTFNWLLFRRVIISKSGLCCLFVVWLTYEFPITMTGVVADIVIAGMFVILVIGCFRHREITHVPPLFVGDADFNEPR